MNIWWGKQKRCELQKLCSWRHQVKLFEGGWDWAGRNKQRRMWLGWDYRLKTPETGSGGIMSLVHVRSTYGLLTKLFFYLIRGDLRHNVRTYMRLLMRAACCVVLCSVKYVNLLSWADWSRHAKRSAVLSMTKRLWKENCVMRSIGRRYSKQ